MATDTTKGTIRFMEEWLTDNIHTGAANGVTWIVTTDGGTAFAVNDSAELQAQSVTGTCDNDMNEIGHRLVWRAQDGSMSMEARLDLAAITAQAVTIGFNDDVSECSDTLPVELSGTTFTSNAGTFIGFVFDIDATNDNWHVFMVDDDADTNVAIACLNTGIAPVADTPQTFKVTVYDQEACNQTRADFWIDGVLVYEMASAIDRDVLLTPHIAHETRAGCGQTMNVHYIETKKSRP